MRKSVQDVTTGTGEIVNGFNRADVAHGNLLRSGHRVSRQISEVSRDMLAGADASQVFTTSLQGLGRSLNLSLGSLAAIGVGAVGIQQVSKMHEEFKKLNEEIMQLAHSNPNWESLNALEEHLTKVHAALAKLREQKTASGGTFGWIGDLVRAWAGGTPREGESMFQMVRRQREEQITGLEGSVGPDQLAIANRRRGKKGDRYSAFNLDTNEEFLTAVNPGSKQNPYLAAVIADELKAGLRELLQTVKAKAEETTKFSLSDIAANSPGYAEGGTIQTVFARDQARKVMALEGQARQQGLYGDQAGAQRTMLLAEQMRTTIPGLKDSEKMTDFKNALDASERLREIRDKVSFQNQ
jgi:ADP-ribose pyrophosphatase YjhB (NUDIX family)